MSEYWVQSSMLCGSTGEPERPERVRPEVFVATVAYRSKVMSGGS